MTEYWDAYDSNFKKIDNIVIKRGDAIPDGMYHLVCEIIVRNKNGNFLLTKRDYSKHLGGLWELSSGGSCLANESALDGAKRELKEETGIDIGEFKLLNILKNDEKHNIYYEYLCDTDFNEKDIVLQKGETIEYMWVNKEYLLNMNKSLFASTRTLDLIINGNF